MVLTVVALAHASSLPMDEKAERECSPDDQGCMARKEACSLAKQMASDWPLQYANMRQTYSELTDVCAGRPLDFTDTPDQPLDVLGTNPEVLSTCQQPPTVSVQRSSLLHHQCRQIRKRQSRSQVGNEIWQICSKIWSRHPERDSQG